MAPRLHISLILIATILVAACNTSNDPVQEIRNLEAQLDTTPPTLEQLNALTAMYLDYSDAHPEDTDLTPEFLAGAASVLREQGMQRQAALLDIRCIREYFTSPRTPEHLTSAAVAITASILTYPPTDTLIDHLKMAFPTRAEMEATLNATLDALKMAAAAETVPSAQQQRFLEYASLSEVSALLLSETDEAPKHFSEAAKTYHSLEAYQKALQLYNWILGTYPNSNTTPRAMFMSAYILETLGQTEGARAAYRAFVDKYPEDQLAEAARISMENLGKTPEEIVSEFK